MKIVLAICLIAVAKVNAWPLKDFSQFEAQFEELSYNSKHDPMFWQTMDEATTVLPTMQNYDETSFSDMTTEEEMTTVDMTTEATEEYTTEGAAEYTTSGAFTGIDGATGTDEMTTLADEDFTTGEMATESTESIEEVTTGEAWHYEDYYYGETTASSADSDQY